MVGCGDVEVLKELDFQPVSILGGCDGLERTHFEQFLLSEGVVVRKELVSTISILVMV